MFLIGGKGQPIRTANGVVHLVIQRNAGGFLSTTACGIAWRRDGSLVWAAEGEEVSCMTCLIHEARS